MNVFLGHLLVIHLEYSYKVYFYIKKRVLWKREFLLEQHSICNSIYTKIHSSTLAFFFDFAGWFYCIPLLNRLISFSVMCPCSKINRSVLKVTLVQCCCQGTLVITSPKITTFAILLFPSLSGFAN